MMDRITLLDVVGQCIRNGSGNMNKHGKGHGCAYCQYHTQHSKVVPSVFALRFIAKYNLLDILDKLNLKAHHSKALSILTDELYK